MRKNTWNVAAQYKDCANLVVFPYVNAAETPQPTALIVLHIKIPSPFVH